MNRSQAAIIGEIRRVSIAKWNSEDGYEWWVDPTRDTPQATPFMYRDVAVFVERVLWDSEDLRVQADSEITVRTYGDGSASGGEVGGGPYGMRVNQVSGPIEEGSKVLFVLLSAPFAIQEDSNFRMVEVTLILDDYRGNWTIRGNQAINADTGRTAPAEALIARLRAERARGENPDDKRGRINPIEE